jgi:hypothetical protein
MEVGFVSEKLSETYREALSHSVSKSMTYNYDVTFHTQCTAREGSEGVGLFQAVTESSDGKLRVWGTQTLCRYGDLWKTPPSCPFEACIDAECIKCKEDWKN